MVKSCGCLNDEARKESKKRFIKNEIGNRYGSLTVIGPYRKNEKGNHSVVEWKCVCDCGTELYVKGNSLRSGHTQSCGCVCSKMERDIKEFLNQIKANFKQQISFDDLRLDGKLLFDFGLYDQNDTLICLIECQGMQHFQNGIKFGKLQRTVTDKMKRDYCAKHNIKLFFIRFDENPIDKMREIYDNTVLSRESGKCND